MRWQTQRENIAIVQMHMRNVEHLSKKKKQDNDTLHTVSQRGVLCGCEWWTQMHYKDTGTISSKRSFRAPVSEMIEKRKTHWDAKIYEICSHNKTDNSVFLLLISRITALTCLSTCCWCSHIHTMLTKGIHTVRAATCAQNSPQLCKWNSKNRDEGCQSNRKWKWHFKYVWWIASFSHSPIP